MSHRILKSGVASSLVWVSFVTIALGPSLAATPYQLGEHSATGDQEK
jgi:hypothetical protein